MKKILLFIALISFGITQAQIVNIPDVNLKSFLINYSPTIDLNGDNEIQISEAQSFTGDLIYYFDLSDYFGQNFCDCLFMNQYDQYQCAQQEGLNFDDIIELYSIKNLAGLNEFINVNSIVFKGLELTYDNSQIVLTDFNNLIELELSFFTFYTNNTVQSINLNNNTNLNSIKIRSNDLLYCNSQPINNFSNSMHTYISSLTINNDINLETLDISGIQLPNLELSTNINLMNLNCSRNLLTSLNLSNNNLLTFLDCQYNTLTTLALSNNTLLKNVYCQHNDLITLDSNNLYIETIRCDYNNLTELNLSSIDLELLNCANNNLTEIDLSDNVSLINVNCENNDLTILDLSNSLYVKSIHCDYNNLTELNLSSHIDLELLNCANNNLTEIDLSDNVSLMNIKCGNNDDLVYLNLKNGNNDNINLNWSSFNNLPLLETVCVDDINSNLVTEINNDVGHTINFSDAYDCNFLNNNQINGSIKFDLNNNGCDSSDLPISNLMLVTNNGTESFATFTQNNGDYLLYTNEGNFTTEVTTNLPNYFNVNPNSETNTFTGFNNTFTADFCIEPNQTINDVNISLIPIISARPGFNTTYHIVYENVGTTQLNGNVTLEFDETKLSFLNASETVNTQTSNSLTFNYTNLNPFETRIIDLEFNVFAPPTVEIDDILNFTATINPIAGDFTADDNVFNLNLTVVGSFDPNDIIVLEGNQILLADADKYLHYVIRFQNTGTASAINVVVTNDLDANLDWSTLQLESSSHNNRVAIKNGNEIEFIFENINLPDNTTDEPNSHGFIAYKIKPKTDIALDDIILNKADIFFDYNSPIETNTTTTTIVNALAVSENTLLDFSVFPIPTENILNIKSKTEITKIKIYSKLGQLIKETTENKIDISNLAQGLYFVKVEDENGNFGIKKFIKR